MTSSSSQTSLLAGDVGGTKTSLAIYLREDNLTEPQAAVTVSNDTANSFEEIVATFLDENSLQPDTACFGVAGPVSNNQVRMTNLSWTIDGRSLAKRFGLRSVILINDLVATAMGAVNLPADRRHTINEGLADPVGAIGVIAPGTGLGEAFLIHHRDSWLPVPSEGGHSSFAPTSEQQRRLLHFMAEHHPHVSNEMVCSGIGIPNLYDFLCSEAGLKNMLRNHPQPTRVIIEEALQTRERREKQNPALQTILLFTAILASEAANLALKVLATGGLFIGGGLPPRILPFLESTEFMNTFARGEYRDMLAAIPIHVILEPKTALIGAAAYGRSHISG